VRDLPITDPGSSKAEGHHALNVEIEVRALVPELGADSSEAERLSDTEEDAGSIPVPPMASCGRVAQSAERLSHKQEVAGSSPASPTSVVVARTVERPPETRGVQVRLLPTTPWLRSSTGRAADS
jgi:hypothetical protein